MSGPPDDIRLTPDEDDLPIALGPVRAEPPRLEGLGGRAVVRDLPDDLVDAIAADLRFQAISCARAWGEFHLVLAAARELEPLYRRLMYDPPLRDIPWDRTHLWVASEDASGSAARALGELVVEHADLPASHFHGFAVGLPNAAAAYERELTHALTQRESGHDRPDMALLAVREGIARGASAHTLLGLCTGDGLAGVGEGAGEPAFAITPRFVRGTRLVSILCIGAERGAALASSHGRSDVAPLGGELRWYLDAPAAEGARGVLAKDARSRGGSGAG
ncbi:MAG: 6-phosphogluconolactonase [Phycisphaerales bacterium]|jgi:hypothetical protein|nr:6-phosphogluconolactonase [Phycisphaerales bacterium]